MVCCLPTANLPDPKWTDELYEALELLKKPQKNLSQLLRDEYEDDSISDGRGKQRGRRGALAEAYNSIKWCDDVEAGVALEVGMFVTMPLIIGERITRVHYQLTSSCRRSEWLLTYFPGDTYPYD